MPYLKQMQRKRITYQILPVSTYQLYYIILMIRQGTKARISILVSLLDPASIMAPVVSIMAYNRAQVRALSCVCLFGEYVGLPWIAIPFPSLLPPYPT